jgi:N-acetylglutamate synthase-like GNAT family acetyltransferase
VPELAQLHFDEWKHLSPDVTLNDRVRKLQKMAASDDIPFVVVATDNDQLAGSAALVEQDMRTRTDLSPWLASVFVKTAFRNKGLGTRLVRRIENEAARRGVRKLYLFTEHARSLYSKLGWHDLETSEYEGVQVTVMFRELAG